MKIITTNTLSDTQVKEITNLQEKCNEYEGLRNEAFLSNEINFNKDIDCFYLCYEKGQLVSFLNTFIPQNDEAEIIAFTHPNFRKRGYFKRLFYTSIDNLKNECIDKILFVIESNSDSGKNALLRFPFTQWERSEYTLFCNINNMKLNNNELKLKNVDIHNKEECSNMIEYIFNMPKGSNEVFVENTINSKDRDAYIAYIDDISIGTFNLKYSDDNAFIYGLGIIDNYKGRGYGKKLLSLALNKAFYRANKVVLDVDSDNLTAYNLYISNGFNIDYQIDYYGLKI